MILFFYYFILEIILLILFHQVILMLCLSNKTLMCDIKWYDPKTYAWKITFEVDECHRPIGLVTVISQFLFSLGSFYVPDSRSVEMLDLFSHSPCWMPMPDMLVCRFNLGVGVLNNCIYVVSITTILLIYCYNLLY